MTRITLAMACLFAGWIVAPAQAGKVKTWRHDKKTDFDKGQLDGVVLGSDGRIELARQIEQIADLDCGTVWDLIRGHDDHLLAATALPGKMIRIDSDGRPEILWKSDEQQAFSVALAADGAVLVGAGPDAAIYKISPEGETTELFSSDDLYVWDLVVDAEGSIYAATGPNGKIYRINPDGDSALFYDTKQQHVLTLALSPNGALLAGTDGAGLVLSITPAGAGRVLYDAAENEVRCLWVDDDGVVYAGTAAGAAAESATSRSSASTRTTSGATTSRARPSSTRSTQKKGANSVYRIDPDGAVHKVLTASALVYDLECAGSSNAPCIVAGTGTQGVLYALDEGGTAQRQLAALDVELVASMLRDDHGRLWLGTGGPGKLYSLAPGFRNEGSFTSPPLDAGLIAQFGSIDWRADVPEGTQVAVSVRSGNTQEPNDTWSEWSVEKSDAASAVADCPTARFLQYRVTLRAGSAVATPSVHSVAVRYMTANQPPQITKLTVPHVEEGDGSKALDKLKITWDAKDPNGDELEYRLSFRKRDWNNWITAKEELTAKEFEWDVTSAPEGVYSVRVEARDHRSNPPEAALDATMTSELFVVDRLAPELDAQLVAADAAQKATFQVELNDRMSPLAKASYSLDSGPWKNLFPEDRIFDSRNEEIRFDIESLTPGTHVIVVRGTDAAGRTGSTDVVFEVGAPQAAGAEPATLVDP